MVRVINRPQAANTFFLCCSVFLNHYHFVYLAWRWYAKPWQTLDNVVRLCACHTNTHFLCSAKCLLLQTRIAPLLHIYMQLQTGMHSSWSIQQEMKYLILRVYMTDTRWTVHASLSSIFLFLLSATRLPLHSPGSASIPANGARTRRHQEAGVIYFCFPALIYQWLIFTLTHRSDSFFLYVCCKLCYYSQPSELAARLGWSSGIVADPYYLSSTSFADNAVMKECTLSRRTCKILAARLISYEWCVITLPCSHFTSIKLFREHLAP